MGIKQHSPEQLKGKKYLETNENKAHHTKTYGMQQKLMKKEVYRHNPYIKGGKRSQ